MSILKNRDNIKKINDKSAKNIAAYFNFGVHSLISNSMPINRFFISNHSFLKPNQRYFALCFTAPPFEKDGRKLSVILTCYSLCLQSVLENLFSNLSLLFVIQNKYFVENSLIPDMDFTV